MKPGNMLGKQTCVLNLKLKDGTKFRFINPIYEVDNGLTALRTVRFIGKFAVQDTTNKMNAICEILPPPKRGWFGKKKVKPEELNKVTIDIQKKKKSIAKGRYENMRKLGLIDFFSGCYTSFVQFDGKTYWRFTDDYPNIEIVQKEDRGEGAITLPSDICNWHVKGLIEGGKYKEADK